MHRVAFIGDSVTEGLGVQEDDTFVRVLERLARQNSQRSDLEALNFGVGGYQTVQIAALLDQVLSYEPDVVVYVLCPNDFDFDDASGSLVQHYAEAPALLLLRWLHQRVAKLRYPESLAGYYQYHYDSTHELVFETIRTMDAKVRANEAHFIVAVLPDFVDSALTEYPFPEYDATIRFLDEAGIRSVGFLRELSEWDVENLAEIALDHWHPDVRGHHLIAEALTQEIQPAMGLP